MVFNVQATIFSTAGIHLESEERPEDLYQRLLAFMDDNLLKADGGITHHGEPAVNEELGPSLENTVTYLWLQLIDPKLPRLVKQRYGTELRTRTLASIKPEISQALDTLLDELRSNDEAKVFRSATREYRPSRQATFSGNKRPPGATPPSRVCPLCKEAGRTSSHFLSTCHFLPDSDKKYFTKARQVLGAPDSDIDLSTVREGIDYL